MRNLENSVGVSVIIAAAGMSRRMGEGINKQFLMLGDMPVLVRTLLQFVAHEQVREVIVVTQEGALLSVRDLIKEYNIPKVKAIVPGGETRQDSVRMGLEYVTESVVLIHDGARPLISRDEIDRVIGALKTRQGAAVGVPVKDTIKRVNDQGIIIETPERKDLVQIQTPQGFHTAVIYEAHHRAKELGLSVTDDCALAEHMGIDVQVVMGSYRNIKITTPEDIAVGLGLLRENGF